MSGFMDNEADLRPVGPGALCWCGCKKRIPDGKRSHARYIDQHHARRAQTARDEARAARPTSEAPKTHRGLLRRLERALRDLHTSMSARSPQGVSIRWRRWTLILRTPVAWTTEVKDADGWCWLGYAWVWTMPRRWQFPVDPVASRCRDGQPILRGWTCGPIDLRWMNRNLSLEGR